MAETFVSNCASSQRCEACPIGRLQDPEERMWAGEIARTTRLDVGDVGEELTIRQLKKSVELVANVLNKPELTAVVVGAMAIGVGGLCESEIDSKRIARMRLRRKPLANFKVTKGRPSGGTLS